MRLSVILPVINETFSLEKTVEILMNENLSDIAELLIVISEKQTSPQSLAAIDLLKQKYPQLIRVIKQRLPFLGGAMRDAFAACAGDYVLMMASDMETDPHSVKDMIAKAKEASVDIVATTRWTQAGSFSGYNPIKLIMNKLFQLFFKFLYQTSLTDLTYGFRLYKSEIITNIKWEELRHTFLLESIVKPLRLGYVATEVPTIWKAREEGGSQNSFFRNFAYFKIGLKTLLVPKKNLLIK